MSGPTRFQQRTADYAIARLWDKDAPAYRFLVADEVGLGKTMVAREIISQTLSRFPRERVDILYLCSSQPIASQNLRKLMIGGHGGTAIATRLTLVALPNKNSANSKTTNRVRYFAITPDTSFNVARGTGHVRERALIYWCLKSRLRPTGLGKLLRVSVGDTSWTRKVKSHKDNKPDRSIALAFVKSVLADAELVQSVRHLAAAAESGQINKSFRRDRAQLIGRLRERLATAGVEAVAPAGLIIADEFQKFSHLLRPLTVDATLAQRLAARLMESGLPKRRVLLLSATPYRLLGVNPAPHEKPYNDFVDLVRYLAGEGQATSLEDALAIYARALRASERRVADIESARDAAQRILRAVMTRTERVGATARADSMLQDRVKVLTVAPTDLNAAVAGRQVARRLKVHDPVEYWKSAPYFLDFMREYQFRSAAVKSASSDRRWIARRMIPKQLLIDQNVLRRMQSLTLPNARLRYLVEDALPAGAERLLWLNPSLPYLRPSGAFADARKDLKRLVFTEWKLAPDSISSLVSYETERRLNADYRPPRKGAGRRRAVVGPGRAHKRFDDHGELLRLTRTNRKGTSTNQYLPALALMIPSAALASLGDPLRLALESRRAIDPREAVRRVTKVVSGALAGLKLTAGSGRIDERWYWAAPLLMDAAAARVWLSSSDPFGFANEVRAPDIKLAQTFRAVLDDPGKLGARPRDLAKVLAEVSLASPANCAFRALIRTMGGESGPAAARRSAFQVARGLQALFNQSDATLAVQLQHRGEPAYWRQVLAYCLDGNLQALLDEQLHLTADALALFEGTAVEKIGRASQGLHDTLTLRRAFIDVTGLERRRRRGLAAGVEMVSLRCRHALRFAEIKDTDGAVSRLDAVREAFNSPFRPFVLASTTVGQEGLDFHPWCHAVVHWNLPRSPVELEQREGRVHRYKGHAVRLNVAAGTGLEALAGSDAKADGDPWAAMFELAQLRDVKNELAPNWVFEGCPSPVKVQRIVPLLQMSREEALWPRLHARLGVYRLVMGLPRQEDLLAALETQAINPEEARTWSIDLRPRAGPNMNA